MSLAHGSHQQQQSKFGRLQIFQAKSLWLTERLVSAGSPYEKPIWSGSEHVAIRYRWFLFPLISFAAKGLGSVGRML